jgi:ribosomal protein L11 methyltransferase
MSNYCEIIIPVQEEAVRELIIAGLSEIGFEGFEEAGSNLKAYITEANFSNEILNNLLNNHCLTYSKSIIKKQNWNEIWESNFEPVQVENFVGIRASFHPPFQNVEHEIVITPKMSFGTGHHATTYMVMLLMKELDFKNKTVFDFGTGTGILAILAEQLGATTILGVDNDDWCIDNASENILINCCQYIEIEKVNEFKSNEIFDIILANINRNIILDNLQEIRKALFPGSQLLLSGLLKADETEIIAACGALGLHHRKTIERSGWIALWLFL